MRVCGIVCEYDPFHSGHAYHIEKTRNALGADAAVICCMSGNYTQRGEPSLLPKHIRAKTALLCGADLVIELPSAYSLLSAEGFAHAGVYLLLSTGILTDLSFGAETDDIRVLSHIASLLSEHELAQKTLLNMKSGISYAAAREKALYEEIKENASYISSPNNILAIEYLKALIRFKSDVSPNAVKRHGAPHGSSELSADFISASAIRELVCKKSAASAAPFMPKESFEELMSAFEKGLLMLDKSAFNRALYSHLLRLSPSDYLKYPDVSEGLEYRIYNSVRESGGYDSALFTAKTKRYPMSRIKRIMLRSFLGLDESFSASLPPYCRVLGFNDKGKFLLSQMRKTCEVPLISKPAHINKLSSRAKKLFCAESFCTDQYYLFLPSKESFTPGIEWRSFPVSV